MSMYPTIGTTELRFGFCRGALARMACALALFLGGPNARAADEVQELSPIMVGNQSASVRPDGSFTVYNIPSGYTRYFPDESTVVFLQNHRGASGEALGTFGFFVQPEQLVTIPDAWEKRTSTQRLRLDSNATVTVDGFPLRIALRKEKKDPITRKWISAEFTSNDRPSIWASSTAVRMTAVSEFPQSRDVEAIPLREERQVTITAMLDGQSTTLRIIARPLNKDFDGDGLPTTWEERFGLNFRDPADALSDLDEDGLVALEEFRQGTNPLVADTDNDGILDGSDSQPLVPETTPPVLVQLAPAPGSSGTRGRPLTIRVQGTDNGKILTMSLAINGGTPTVAFSDTIEVTHQPTTTTPVVIEAMGIDVAGNTGSARFEIPVQAGEDVLLVRGRVLDVDGTGVSGAEIKLSETRGGHSDAEGGFVVELPLTEVPAVTRLIVHAAGAPGNRGAYRTMTTPAVGELDVGDIQVTPQAFDNQLGTRQVIAIAPGQPISSWVPDAMTVTLPFEFPFYSGSYTSISLNSHGELVFGSPSSRLNWPRDTSGLTDAERTSIFGAGPARIAPFWSMLNLSGRYYFDLYGQIRDGGASTVTDFGLYHRTSGEEAILTWYKANNALTPSGALVTFQTRLHANGRFEVAYSSAIAQPAPALLGITPGGGVQGDAVDLLTAGESITAGDRSVCQFIPAATLVANRGMDFTRAATGGYRIVSRTFPSHTDTILAGVLSSQGQPVAGTTVRLSSGERTTTNQRGFFAFIVNKRPIHVDPVATGNRSGTSWADAFTSLQEALSAAKTGDEVWVKQGTYFPERTQGGSTTNPFFFFGSNSTQAVSVYGGFRGDETARHQRNWKANPTILSGDIRFRPGVTTLCSLIVALSQRSEIDGFIIEDSRNFAVDLSNNAKVRNCVIRRHTGSGVRLGNSSSLLSCVVTGVTAPAAGGTAVEFSGSSARMENCLITGNTSASAVAAGVRFFSTGGTIVGCTLTNNISTLSGTPRAGAISGSAVGVTIRNTIISANSRTGTAQVSGIFPTYVNSCVNGEAVTVGNLNSDPLFINSAQPAGADGQFMTADDGLTLSAASPCIDKGLNTAVTEFFDVAHAPRVQVSSSDMGCYETGIGPVPESVVPTRNLDGPLLLQVLIGEGAGAKQLGGIGIFPNVFNHLGDVDVDALPPSGNAGLPKPRPEGLSLHRPMWLWPTPSIRWSGHE